MTRCQKDWDKATYLGRLGWLVMVGGSDYAERHRPKTNMRWSELPLNTRRSLCQEWAKWVPNHALGCWKDQP